MIDIKYQIITVNDLDTSIILEKTIKSVIENLYIDLQKEDIRNILSMQKQIKINKQEKITLFSLLIDLDTYPQFESYLDQFQEDFEIELKDNADLLYIFKFSDTLLKDRLTALYRRIFDLEMRLRDAITLIFVLNNKKDYHDLLFEHDIKLQIDKDLIKKKQERYRNLLENDLFYILFSDYIKFSTEGNLKKNTLESLIQLISESSTISSLKKKLSQKGITDQKSLEFLLSIKEDLDSIEKMRNCIAHNRTPLEEERENFEKSIKELHSKLDDFYQNIK